MEILLLLILCFFIILIFLKIVSINEKIEVQNNIIKNLGKKIQSLTIPESKPVEKIPKVETPVVEVFEIKEEPIIEYKEKVEDIPIEKTLIEIIPEKPIEVVEKQETKQPLHQPIGNKTSSTYERVKSSSVKREPTWWESFRENNPDLEKFIGENLINKLGILILVLGISYFVKYAIDRNWINETARVGIGILCGAIVLGFAHKLRKEYKGFSSVLVAGAIAIFYFTIAIAFHQFHLINQTTAFIIMVIITAFSAFISVMYDSKELAILSLIGGFAVPFMVSTSEGNYKVLFTYITILDMGILAIAYMKRWSIVTILAFLLTSVLFGAWLSQTMVSQKVEAYPFALIFATSFYLIFIIAFMINNLRNHGSFSKIELMMLISNTFFYFSTGMIVLSSFHPEFKGLFTILLALFNLILAWILYKRIGSDKNVIFLLIGITLTFVTLTIPIQFSGNYITLFWAAESVMLLWLSQKSKIIYFRFASIIVQILMFGSLIIVWADIYSYGDTIVPLFRNSGFIAGVFVSLSLFACSMLTKNETNVYHWQHIEYDPQYYHRITLVLSIIVLYITGLIESIYQVQSYFADLHSQQEVVIVYHLLFTSVVIFLINSTKDPKIIKYAVIIALINIGLYIIYFSHVPFGELKDNLDLTSNSRIAFYLHFISLACIIYQSYTVWNDARTNNTLNMYHQKWFMWVASFVVVFILSNEVLLLGVNYLVEPTPPQSQDAYSIAYTNYNKAVNFVVKAVYPILWGVLAFIFLSIGFKRHNRELRIIALTLLGLTIVKLFVYDISNVSETGKIVAFILLGLLILIMSFAYQKIKKIVLEHDQDKKKNESK